jgi:hypothetical protein
VNTSDTPETHNERTLKLALEVFTELANTLKQERDEWAAMCGRYKQERDEALAQIKKLIYIGERAIALAEIDFENDKFGIVSELRYELTQIMQEGAK